MTLIRLGESVIESVSDNLRTLILVGGAYVGAVETGHLAGYPDIPSVPGWWDLGLLAGGAVVLVGWIVGSKLADLLPDPRGHFIVAQEAHDEAGGEVWELNDEAWQELNVVEGDLFRWEGVGWNVYECRRFNPETLTAVANWKGTVPSSELSSHTDPDTVMDQIRELRESHEQEARYGRWIRQSLPSLLRYLDKRRAKTLNATLDKTISPTWDDDRTIDDLIEDRVPDEALPDYFRDDAADEPDEHDDAGEVIGFDILDDSDALDATADLDGVADPLMNDGGRKQ